MTFRKPAAKKRGSLTGAMKLSELGVAVSVALLLTSSGDVAAAFTARDVGPVCCPNLI